MKSQINLTQENEQRLKTFKALMYINGIELGNKEVLINKNIEILDVLIKSLDDESLDQLTNLKKSI